MVIHGSFLLEKLLEKLLERLLEIKPPVKIALETMDPLKTTACPKAQHTQPSCSD